MTPDALRAVLDAPTTERLGWTLLHFVWEGAAVAALLALTLAALRRRQAGHRHAASLAALLVMAATPAVTFFVLPQPHRAPPVAPVSLAVQPAAPVPSPTLPTPRDAIEPADARIAQAPSAETVPLKDRLRPALPWLVAAWLAGVALLSAWHLGGWLRVERLKRAHTRPVGEPWQRRLAALCGRLRVTRPVRLLESALVQAPAVAGWLRPVILVPAGALTGLSAHQLEAILAHELAHVRRHDYLVNVLQAVVETLLFYHPAVWWVSAQVRREREDCCDDEAAAATGGAVAYARALAALEELRGYSPPQPALAASGSPLLRRVRRLLGLAPPRPPRRTWSLFATALAASLALAPAATRLGGAVEGKEPAVDAAADLTELRVTDLGDRHVQIRAISSLRVVRNRSPVADGTAEAPPVLEHGNNDGWVSIERRHLRAARPGDMIVAEVEAIDGRKVTTLGRLKELARVELLTQAAYDAQVTPPAPRGAAPAPAGANLFTLRGTVTDAATGKPIKAFRTVRAPADNAPGRPPAPWQPHTIAQHADGAFEIPLERAWPRTRLRVDAEGYAPAVSRVIEQQPGVVTVDFKLEPAEGIRGVVLTPDGGRASGAQVTLATTSNEVRVEGGRLIFNGTAVPSAAPHTNKDGAFALPPEIDPGMIVVTHPTGYAEVSSAQFRSGEHIRLRPWGEIRGRLAVPGAGKDELKVVASSSRPEGDAPTVSQYQVVRPNDDGTFTIDHFGPGHASVGVHAGLLNGSPITGTFATTDVASGPGAAEITLGGRGRPVTGRITAADARAANVDWSKVKLRLVLEAPHVGFPGDDAMWKAYGEFLQGDRAKAYQRDFTPGPDGAFRLDDVPQGTYQLIGPVRAPGRVVVEPMPGGSSDHPLHLGDLPLAGEAPVKGAAAGEVTAPGALTPDDIARLDPAMASKARHRDELKSQLERLSLTLGPEHRSIIGLKKELTAAEREIADAADRFNQNWVLTRAKPGDERQWMLLAERDREKSDPAPGGNFYVGGNVPRAGVYRLEGRVNLLQALIAAGLDVNANANEKVQLFRQGPNDQNETVTSLTVGDLLDQRDRDVFVQPDDTILVGSRSAPAENRGGAKGVAPVPAKKRSVLLVTPDNHFLSRTLSALAGVEVKQIEPREYPLQAHLNYDVIIYDRFVPTEYPDRGRFVCVGIVPKPLNAGEKVSPEQVRGVSVARWDRDHAILRGVDLSRVYIKSTLRITPAEDSRVLAQADTEPATPLVVLHRENGRTFLVLPFDVLQSNWPLRPSFPIFVQRAVDYLADDETNH